MPPSWMGIIVTPASADAQTSRQLCGFFLSSGHSPRCSIYLIDNSHCQNHISPGHSLCCLICTVFCWCQGLKPQTALAWAPTEQPRPVLETQERALPNVPCDHGEATPLPSYSLRALMLSPPEKALKAKHLLAEFYF